MKYIKKAIVNYQKGYFVTLRRGKYCVVMSKNWLQVEHGPEQELNKNKVLGRFDTEDEAVEFMFAQIEKYIKEIREQ